MPNLDDNLAFAPAHELADMIADKRISSVELTELYLSRIERLDGQLNSYLTPTPEIALEQARRADEATARGESLGALHGLPISIKDLQMTAGVRTTGGSLAFKDRVPDANADLRAEGTGRGSRDAGQDEHAGIRTARREREPAWRALPQSVEHRAHVRWVQRRRGSVRSGGTVRARHGRRRGRLDPHTGQLQRDIRHQAHARARVQLYRR